MGSITGQVIAGDRSSVARTDNVSSKSTSARSKKSISKPKVQTVSTQSVNTGCFVDLSDSMKKCSLQYGAPNFLGNPNVSFGDYLKWFVKPSESGIYVKCLKDAFKEFMSCNSGGTEFQDCISDYVDLDNRVHHFPCDQDCSYAKSEVSKIYGCDGFYPNYTKDPDANTSKGIVNSCNTSLDNWCACPYGAKWNTLLNKCECENSEYVPYYGPRRGDNTYEIGYCAPRCEKGKIYDLRQQQCVTKPQWY